MTMKNELTPRDQSILCLLGEYGCVTADRIKVQFWNDNPISRAHYRRLGVLKKRQFIENVVGDSGATIGYRLTKKGKEIISAQFNKASAPVFRRGYKTQFEHDQLLIDVRRILEVSPLVRDFKTEPELRKKMYGDQISQRNWERKPTIPDAVFTLVTPGHAMPIAIELELTVKSKRRYARIFRNHLLARHWKLVIYIVKDEKFRVSLMALLGQIKENDIHLRMERSVNGVYFCSIDNFLRLKLATPLVSSKREISLEQIAQNFGMKR